MPTVSVGRDRLFEALGQTYTEKEFDELCFEFGIELDDVTTEKAIVRKEKHLDESEASEDEEVIYKVEVPANRYDLLCLEGLARALRIFLGKEQVPDFRLSISEEEAFQAKKPLLQMTVKPEVFLIRPFVVAAVLRGVRFDSARYDSFIELQDRLHQNLCRKRTLVAIGTHDLDTLTPPFTYEALPPSEIRFVPLKQTREFRADELLEFYKSDNKLKKFLPILEGSPVCPVIYDARRTVLSLPPIINSAHSAITLATRNVLIECTALDLTKANTVLNTVVTMFSEYCTHPFEVEPVRVTSPLGTSTVYPDLSSRVVRTTPAYVNRGIGVSLSGQEIVKLLKKMQLPSTLAGDQSLLVTVPPTRSDVLHPCDVMEDVAIAYGYNNIERTEPRALCQGRQQPLNQLSDLLRAEVAQAGFTEILTFALVSRQENFELVNLRDEGATAVVIGNPRTSDFEAVRTSLLPGLLKTMGHNKDAPRPLKLFEVSDVCLLDSSRDVGARNERRIAALYCNLTSGFEVIHGLVDRIMQVLGVALQGTEEGSGRPTFAIEPSQSPQFFAGRQASVLFNGVSVGTFGVVHPQILKAFDIPDPCSALELNLEPFFSPDFQEA